MNMKHVYVWFDGDVKRHYFSSKSTFNKWLTEFVREGFWLVPTKEVVDAGSSERGRTESLV